MPDRYTEDSPRDSLEFEDSGVSSDAMPDRPFGEGAEMELAARLLEVSDEPGLERFLGKLISRAARAVGGVLPRGTGYTLARILKFAVSRALPNLGRPIPSLLGDLARVAQRVPATRVGRLFGLELEGMSPEDQEFEVARRVVRFAGAAAARAARAPSRAEPGAIARRAAMAAAGRHAPGLAASTAPPAAGSPAPEGRWLRRGRHVVIVNC